MEIVSIEKKDLRDDAGVIQRPLGESRRPQAQKATAGGWKGGSRARRSAGS